MNPALVLLYMIASSQEEVERLGELLLQKRLVACANLLQGEMNSIFYWPGNLDHSKEQLVLLKTKQDHFSVIQKLLSEMHSYDSSCLLALPILGRNPDFLNWIKEETHPQELIG